MAIFFDMIISFGLIETDLFLLRDDYTDYLITQIYIFLKSNFSNSIDISILLFATSSVLSSTTLRLTTESFSLLSGLITPVIARHKAILMYGIVNTPPCGHPSKRGELQNA